MKRGDDPRKNALNIRERALPFDDVALLDWATSLNATCGNLRARADGPVKPGHDVNGENQRGDTTWVISFRRAHHKERHSYGKKA